MQIQENDLAEGLLPVVSYIRPDKLFTADSSLIKKKIAKISTSKLAEFKASLSLALGLN